MTTYAGTAGASGNGVTSISVACDFGSGSNRAGGVFISSSGTVTGVTIGGTACTAKGSRYTGDSSYATDIYALSAPATGSQTVAVSFSASAAGQMTVVAMTDADQTTSTLTDTRVDSTDTSTAPSATAASTSGDLVVGFTASNTSFTPVTPGSGVTEIRDNEDIYISQWTGYKTATGTTTTIDGTATGFESWNMSAIAFKTASGGGLSATVNQVTETDTAQAVTHLKAKALGQTTETDTAQAITHLKAKALGQVAETDTAQIITASGTKLVAVVQAYETDVAQAITGSKVTAVGLASETDNAFGATTVKRLAVAQVIEIDEARAITWSPKYRLLGQAMETDLSQAIAVSAIITYGRLQATARMRAALICSITVQPSLTGEPAIQ